MFAAAIVGGIGSPIGAVIGGYVIAFSEITLTYAYKKFFIYLLPENLEPSGLMQVLSTDYKFAISFIIGLNILQGPHHSALKFFIFFIGAPKENYN